LTFPLVAIPMTVSYLILWVTRRRDLRPLVHLGACGIISIVWYRDAFDVLTNSREGFANHALIVAIGPSDTYDWLFYAGDLIPIEESLGQIVALGAILALAAAAITAAFRSRRFAPTAFLFAPATITLALAWAGDVALWDRYASFFVFSALVVLPITSIEDQLETVCESTETAIVLFNHYDPTDMLDDECLRNRTDAELHLVPMVRGLSVSVWLVG
jgi:hypothetical protein